MVWWHLTLLSSSPTPKECTCYSATTVGIPYEKHHPLVFEIVRSSTPESWLIKANLLGQMDNHFTIFSSQLSLIQRTWAFCINSKMPFYILWRFYKSPVLLKLFKPYLGGRTQVVRVASVSSEVLSISTGVPQGSVLGPLLFLVYMTFQRAYDTQQSSNLLMTSYA